MKIGAVFPQTEIGADPGAVRAFAETAEGLGYRHILAYDHVLGASTANRPTWAGPYTSESMFHEVLVLFGYLAGITRAVELVSGVLILPQRQTALVAKQAAEVDRLSGGRLRLGVGVGWNEVEYIGLEQSFRDRGKRCEEQIELMRSLWTEEVIDFAGRWHRVPEAGINPLPVQRPIPVWIGGYVAATMRRIGRIGDGWFPGCQPGEQLDRYLAIIAESARGAGRDPSAIGMEGTLSLGRTPRAEWGRTAEGWREAGASHLCVETMDAGLDPEGHVRILEEFKRETDLW